MKELYNIENSLGYLTGRYSRLLLMRVAQAFADKDIDVTAEQWTVLVRLWSDGDGISQSVISEMISKDKPRTSRILAALESNDMIYRVNSKNDNREKLVYLSDKGKEVMKIAPSVVQDTLEASYKGINTEKLDICREVLRQAFNNAS